MLFECLRWNKLRKRYAGSHFIFFPRRAMETQRSRNEKPSLSLSIASFSFLFSFLGGGRGGGWSLFYLFSPPFFLFHKSISFFLFFFIMNLIIMIIAKGDIGIAKWSLWFLNNKYALGRLKYCEKPMNSEKLQIIKDYKIMKPYLR